MQDILANKFVAGALSGLLTAAWVDIAAFRSWKSFDEAKQYNWSLAAWRWLQGTVTGLLTAAGLNALS